MSPSNWIILQPQQLTALLTASYHDRALPLPQWIESASAKFAETGNLNPQRLPFILLLDRVRHECTHHMVMKRSIDWTIFHTVNEVVRDKVDVSLAPEFHRAVRDILHPFLEKRLAHQGRIEALEAIDEVVYPLAFQLIDASPQATRSLLNYLMDAAWKTLPPATCEIVHTLLEEADVVARRAGLNGGQLFAENKLHLLMPGNARLVAFNALPAAVQEKARRWLIAAHDWQKFYPTA
jgi:hypothetical protein